MNKHQPQSTDNWGGGCGMVLEAPGFLMGGLRKSKFLRRVRRKNFGAAALEPRRDTRTQHCSLHAVEGHTNTNTNANANTNQNTTTNCYNLLLLCL